MKGIVWLASYPKSGNTWFRAFLKNLLSDRDAPADINDLECFNFSYRHVFDAALGWETSDLSADAVDRLRPQVQDVLAREENAFFKVHEAFVHPITGERLFSLHATRAALYFIRNPLDVAVSYSNHLGIGIDAAIERMNDQSLQIASDSAKLHSSQLAQPVGDWSWHVRSWVDAPGLNLHVLRYEDMLGRAGDVFASACRFAGLPDDSARVARALEHCSFENLQLQEKTKGFREAYSGTTQFFRRGCAGAWREILSPEQVEGITNSHGEIMHRFGYLRSDGSCS